VAILGLGLMGSSLARALAEKAPGVHIAGFDLSQEALRYATEKGFIHSQHAHAGQAAAEADIIVLASPPSAFASLAADIARFVSAGAIVTDTGSVKRYAVSAIQHHVPKDATFVPGHPIAGSELSGVTAGLASLFTGKRVILTPAEEDVLSDEVVRVRQMWEIAGARVEYMPPELHDRIYAYVSHLTQLVAFAGIKPLSGLPAATSEPCRRASRLTRSNPDLWIEICLANADYVTQALGDFAEFAAQMQGELSQSQESEGENAEHAAELFQQVVATCLIATASLLQELTGVHPARYAGAGFTDMTAPAVANPDAALAAISSHHRAIGRMLKEMLSGLQVMRSAIEYGDKAALMKAFKGE
jgi:prephenate dehydrogenase